MNLFKKNEAFNVFIPADLQGDHLSDQFQVIHLLRHNGTLQPYHEPFLYYL